MSSNRPPPLGTGIGYGSLSDFRVTQRLHVGGHGNVEVLVSKAKRIVAEVLPTQDWYWISEAGR
jgi:hypothetical protein